MSRQMPPQPTQQPTPPVPRRRGPRGPLGVLAVIGVIAAAAAVGLLIGLAPGGEGGNGGGTVTFRVDGDAADVSYGPAGSELSGGVPMDKSLPLSNPSYYFINAQLRGDGNVECRISVNGTLVSQAVASGGYHVAICEISKFGDQWQSTAGS